VALFAVLLPLFLGLGAIAVDVGYWYVVKKTAQDAADAAALAAAAELPDKFAAEQAAQTYVGANMPDATWSVKYPDPTEVEVVVAHPTETFFGRIFGRFEGAVSGRAVAERLNTDGNVALFTFSADCSDALLFEGTNMSVNGYVHSNGQYAITSDPDAPRWWAADGTRVDCGASVNPHGSARFGGFGYDDPSAGTLPRELFEELAWPTWYTPSQLGISWPTGCPQRRSWTRSNTTIPPGVYCARAEIHIDADNVTGRVTLVAPKITVKGDGQDLAPYTRRLLFFTPPNTTPSPADDGPTGYCEPMPDMELRGERYTWAGTIFSPCGRVRIGAGEARAGSPHVVGTILALHVNIFGDDFSMIGRSNFDVNAEVALTE